jgi:hypothetical protein
MELLLQLSETTKSVALLSTTFVIAGAHRKNDYSEDDMRMMTVLLSVMSNVRFQILKALPEDRHPKKPEKRGDKPSSNFKKDKRPVEVAKIRARETIKSDPAIAEVGDSIPSDASVFGFDLAGSAIQDGDGLIAYIPVQIPDIAVSLSFNEGSLLDNPNPFDELMNNNNIIAPAQTRVAQEVVSKGPKMLFFEGDPKILGQWRLDSRGYGIVQIGKEDNIHAFVYEPNALGVPDTVVNRALVVRGLTNGLIGPGAKVHRATVEQMTTYTGSVLSIICDPVVAHNAILSSVREDKRAKKPGLSMSVIFKFCDQWFDGKHCPDGGLFGTRKEKPTNSE